MKKRAWWEYKAEAYVRDDGPGAGPMGMWLARGGVWVMSAEWMETRLNLLSRAGWKLIALTDTCLIVRRKRR